LVDKYTNKNLGAEPRGNKIPKKSNSKFQKKQSEAEPRGINPKEIKTGNYFTLDILGT
jgi:hypothetical protein